MSFIDILRNLFRCYEVEVYLTIVFIKPFLNFAFICDGFNNNNNIYSTICFTLIFMHLN